jgi:CPA2 family monovalent cation:H+ antiporter-2
LLVNEARTFLQDLALVFCVATIATLLFQRLRLPAVLGYLVAGLIVGPHTPVPLFADLARVEVLAELGIVLVVFVIGLEFSVGRLARTLPITGVSGAVQITAMLWLGYTLGRLVGWSGNESLYLGGMVCISSTMIVARALGRGGEDPRLVDNVFGILIVQDLAAIVLIAVFTAIASGTGMPAGAVLRVVGELVLFLAGAVVVGLLLIPRLIREANHRGASEVVLIAVIGVCFGLSLLAEHLGYSVALGAFIAGSLIAESGLRRRIERMVEPIRDMFAAVFFVSIGMLVDPHAIAAEWRMIAGVTALVVIGQTLFVSIGSLLSGRPVEIAVRSGMCLAQIGEFSFIIVGVGVAAGQVRSSLLAIAVGVAVITTFLTPLMVGVSGRCALWVEARLPHRVQTFTALYATWFEALRGGTQRQRSPVRHHIAWMAIDVIATTAIIIAFAIARRPLAGEIATRLGVSIGVAGALALAAALALALPFAIGLARHVRGLGVGVAAVALPGEEPGRVDLADAPRRAFVVTLQLAATLAVLLPLIALTQPFLPLYAGLSLLAVLLTVLGISFWRRAANLHEHVRAGAELVLEVLDRQRHPDDSDAAPSPALPDILPGLGPLVSVAIDPSSPAVDRTLADINLRAKSGATVIAIQRATGEGVGSPTGHETLTAGDLLTLTGTTAAVERARRLLAGLSSDPDSGHEP